MTTTVVRYALLHYFHIRPQDICIFDHAYVAAGLQGCVQLRRRLCCNGIMQYMKQSCLSHQ